MALGIKKNDKVMVITGKYKGKTGRVVKVMPREEKIIIEKINIVKRHMKPSKKYAQGGIIEKEAPIHRSNVMLVCPKCEKPTRIASQVLLSGDKVRVCKKCKEVIDI